MGGKNKPRVKGNAKPSSSANAAEILARSGGQVIGFGGADSYHDEDRDSFSLNGDWSFAFGKLKKKDSITKAKGLNEIRDLIKRDSEENVKAGYSQWPRLFNRLSIDVDVKVRELTSVVMGEFAAKLKKGIAAELRGIVGNWYCNTFDICREVSEAAESSLRASFPNVPNVLKFYKNEMMTHFENNLIKLKQDDLASKYLSSADLASQYERIVYCSIMGFAKFIMVMNKEHPNEVLKGLEGVLESKSFWKLAGKKSKITRRAFFELTGTLFEMYPNVVSSSSGTALVVMFNGLCEDNVSFISRVWSALLRFLKHVPGAWSSWTPSSSVFPTLFKHVKSVGCGTSKVLYESLLPFLSFVSQDIKFSSPWFYENFFGALVSSVKHENFDKTNGDCAVELFNCILECIQFSVFELEEFDSVDERKALQKLLCLKILPRFLCSLVEDEFGMEKMRFSSAFKQLFVKLGTVLCFLCKKESCSWLVTSFFEEIEGSFLNVLSKEDSSDRIQSEGRYTRSYVSCVRIGEFFYYIYNVAKDKSKDVAVLNKRLNAGVNTLSRDVSMRMEHKISRDDMNKISAYCLLLADLACCDPELNFFDDIVEALHGAERKDVTPVPFFNAYLWLAKVSSEEHSGHMDRNLIHLLDGYLRALVRAKKIEEVRLIFNLFLKNYSSNACSKVLLSFLRAFLKLCTDLGVEYSKTESREVEKLALLIFQEWIPRDCVSGVERQSAVELLVFVLTERVDGRGLISEAAYQHTLCLFYQYIDDFLQGFGHPEFYKSFENQGSVVKELCEVLQIHFLRISRSDCSLPKPIVELLPFMFKLSIIELPVFFISVSSDGDDDSRESTSESMKNQLTLAAKSAWTVGLKLLLNSTSACACEDRKQVLVNIINPIKRAVLEKDSIHSIEKLVEQVVDVVHACCTNEQEKQEAIEEALFDKDQWENAELLLETCRDVLAIMSGSYTILTRSYGRNGICAQKNSELGLHTHTKFLVYTTGLVRHLGLEDFFLFSGADHQFVNPRKRGWILLKLLWCRAWLHNVYGYKHVEYRRSFFAEPLHEDLFEQCSFVESFLLQLFGDFTASRSARRVKEGVGCRLSLAQMSDFIRELLEDSFRMSCKLEYVNCQVFGRLLREVMKSGYWGAAEVNQFYLDNVAVLKKIDHNTLRTLQAILEAIHLCNAEIDFVSDLMETHLKLAVENSSLFGSDVVEAGSVGSLCIVNSCCLATSKLKEGSADELLNLCMRLLRHLRKWYTVGSEIVGEADERAIAAHLEVAIFCRHMLDSSHESFDKDDWGFVMARCFQWLSTEDPLDYLITRALRYQGLMLLEEIISLVKTEEVYDHSSDVYKLWHMHEGNIFGSVLPLFLQESDCDSAILSKLSHHMLLSVLSSSLSHVPFSVLTESSCVAELFKKIYIRHADVQKRAFALLFSLLQRDLIDPDIVSCDSCEDELHDINYSSMVKSLAEVSNEGRAPPSVLMNAIRKGQLEMGPEGKFPSSYHAVVELGASCEALYTVELLEAFSSEEKHLRLGYFLCWILLIECLETATPRLRSHYIAYLREQDMVSTLLHIAYQHIPLSSKTMKEYSQDFILNLNLKSLSLVDQGQGFHRLCSHVYYRILKATPTLARLWWNDLSRKMYLLVEKHTCKYFSPVLIEQEMIAVKESKTEKLDGLVVKASLSRGEVNATYDIDEVSITLVVNLSSFHPLKNVEIASPYRVGLSESQWRKWLLQITLLLTAQNGSVIEALLLWKENIDKRFSGVEDCTICYAVIHGTNYSLPNLRCKTCQNRFHSACLYKWFQTSGNSTCPLCRNLF